ncbi:MAG TPA: hypothetical protein DCQ31_14465 [Bacteroidales bacterium]|nr:hypothetical protein [Bacteroidales bacterium]
MILVTGITGQSGKWLLKRLIAESEHKPELKVRAAVRDLTRVPTFEFGSLDIEFTIGDLFDTEFVDQAMIGVDTVLHLAGIGKSEIIIEAALKQRVKWVILVHTASIYSKYKAATLPYLKLESKVSELLKGQNIDLTILRPTMIYGNINDGNISVFIKMVDKIKLFPVISGGNYPMQPVHEKDLGEAYFQLLSNASKTKNKNYVLSGKEPISMIDVFKTIASQLSKKPWFISIPFPVAYLGAWFVYLLSFKKYDYRERTQRMVESRAYPHTDAATDFGYAPVSFSEGIRQEIASYLESKK